MTEPGADGQGPWAASLQGGDAAMPLPQAQQQQPQHQQQHLQPGAAAPTLEAVPVPHIAADPVHLDRAALPQSAALYQVPPAQQFAPQAEVPYAADAYQAVMGSAPLLQGQPGSDVQPQMTPDMLQQMQLIAQLQQQQAAAAAAAATGGMPLQQQAGQQPMDASAAYATGAPGNQAPIRPGEFAYEPQAPKISVSQEDVDSQQAKACRLCGVAKMLDEFHVNNSNADKHDTRCKACCALYEKEKRAKKTRVLEPTVAEKQCRSCQENKPASEFYRYTYSKDGLYQQCKACHARAGETRLAKLAGGDSDGSGKPPVESKTCSKCNEEKPKSEFYASKYLSSGLHSQCKRCVRAGQEKRVRCNPEQAATEKTCRKCRTTKKQDEFYFNNLVEDGLTTYCRACHQDKGSPAPGPDGAVPVRSGTRYNVTQPTKSEKHCKKCDTVKPADEFYHIKSSSDGLASNCKACAVQIANSTRKHFVPEPTVEHKVCKACGVDKPASEFYRNRTNADGLFGKCKLCSDTQAETNRKPRVRHNIQEPTVEQKVCTKCNDLKPAGEFNRDKTKADGLQFRCKACVHDYMKRRRRTENVRKREELEAERLAHEPDNLAVLAQAAEPTASAVAAQLGLAPGVPLPPNALQQLQRLSAHGLAVGAAAPQAMGLQLGMGQQQQPPVSYASAGEEQAPQQAALAAQMQEYAAMRQGMLAPADGVSAAEPPPQQQQAQAPDDHQPPPQQPHQAGSPVFVGNDDDMNITVDVNELQQEAAVAAS